MVLLDHVRRRAGELVAADPEALLEEARQRARRRRRQRAATLVTLLLVAAAVGGWVASRSGGAGVVQTASTPFANLRAFAGHGELAFVSRGAMWVMDGATGTLRRLPVPAGFTPSSPSLSHDGRWLAYLADRPNPDGSDETELWLADGDGRAARMIAGPNVDQLVGWSPTADLLALTTYRSEPFAPYPAVTRLDLIAPPSSSRRTLVQLSPTRERPDSIWSAAWSPDGRQIAVSAVGFLTSVRVYPVAGGTPTEWFHIRNNQPFPDHICSGCGGANEVIADLVGWWTRWGIGFWVYCCGAVHDNDGSPIALIARPGARPRVLARTLSSRVTDAIAAGPDGALAVVADQLNGGGREIGTGKTVETCSAAPMSCTPVPGATTWVGPNRQRCVIPSQSPRTCLGSPVPPAGRPGSGVSLDPSWSPGGGLLAYIRAPTALTAGWPDAAWYAAHAIYVWNAHSGATSRIDAVDGASVPTWSADGRDLLYVSGDGLWLAPVDRGSPVEIAHPLFPPSGLYKSFTNDYYGQIPWTAQFSWWSP
jgi:hypothetical protein